MNWDNNIFNYVEDSFYGQCFYRAKSTDEWSLLKEWTTLSLSNQGGIGFFNSFDYSSGHNYYNKGGAVFLLEPYDLIGMKTGKTVSTSINYNYVHDRMPAISGTVSFSYNSFGIGIQYNSLFADYTALTKNFYFSR